MKKILSILILLLCFSFLKAQTAKIVDVNKIGNFILAKCLLGKPIDSNKYAVIYDWIVLSETSFIKSTPLFAVAFPTLNNKFVHLRCVVSIYERTNNTNPKDWVLVEKISTPKLFLNFN